MPTTTTAPRPGGSTRRGRSPAPLTRCCAPPRSTRVPPAAAVRYARVFKALGDPTRLEIIGLLAGAGGELCVCEIECHFDLTQPTISHHLRALREAGVVTSERRGQWVYYALDPRALARAASFSTTLI